MKTLAGTALWPAQEDGTTPENEKTDAGNSETSCQTNSKLPPIPSRFGVRKPIGSTTPSFQMLEKLVPIIGKKTQVRKGAEEMEKQISGKQNQTQQEIPAQENPFAKPSHLPDVENLQIKIPKGYARVVPDTGIETVSPERIQTLDKPSLLPKGMEKICKKILMGPSGWFLIRKP